MDVLRRDRFALPPGVVYLDGNSLGPLPVGAADAVARATRDEWGALLIRGWNEAGWMDAPARLGDRIAPLIGAPAGSVAVGDTLSIKVYQLLDAALRMRPDRRVILSDNGNFPTDLYMAQGLVRTLDKGHRILTPAPEAVADAIDDSVAVLMLTEIDYRTGRRHDMAALTARAHAAGAVVIWDLAHSAGAVPLDLAGSGAEFAAGCTYKYLNGGPGAPAFAYVRPDLAGALDPALAGWLGHQAPFAFEPGYRPAPGVARLRVGTPPVLQMAALDAALDVWDGVDMAALRAASLALGDRLIDGVAAACPDLRLVTPRAPAQRGSQVSFAHPEGYAIIQALIAEGVIGDFRAPDILRFGITPLYLDADDIDAAVETIARVMDRASWNADSFRRRAVVT